MSSIDERIVEMKFNNAQFQAGVEQTTSSLGQLKQALGLEGIESGVSKISGGFSAFGAIAFGVIQNLTAGAMNLGKKMVGTVLDPIIEGGKRRALNLEQAQFQLEGLGVAWEEIRPAILGGVKDTAYGLDEAARAASQFAASGVPMEKMESSLRAISGVAAMTGSSYEDISSIFTKVAGQGRVMGDDLLRMSSRGQNAAATLAKYLGITETEVREMVTAGKIDFETFAAAMDDAFGEHATKANETFTGAMSNMKAALARVGADFAASRFEMLRVIFNALTPVIDKVKEALLPLEKAFDAASQAAGKRVSSWLENLDLSNLGPIIDRITRTIQNLYAIAMSVFRPIRDAFREIFPSDAGAGLLDFVSKLQNATAAFNFNKSTLDGLQRTFRGFFALLDIGGMVIKGIVTILGTLLGALFDGSGGILQFTGGIGDFIVAVRDALRSGEGFTNVIQTIANVLATPIKAIKALIQFLGQLFNPSGLNADGLKNALNDVTEALDPMDRITSAASKAWIGFKTVVSAVWNFIQPVVGFIAGALKRLGGAIQGAVRGGDMSMLFDIFNAAALGGIVLVVKKFFGNIESVISGGFGFLDSVKGVLNGVTGSLEAMQTNLKAGTLMKIAIAIGILAISVVALSLIDPVSLTSALTAITVMFTQLGVALTMFQKISMGPGLARIPLLASGLILLGIAVNVLATAVIRLSGLSWNELLKGLTGLAGILGMLVATSKLMQSHMPGLISSAMGFILLGAAIKILASAVSDFAQLSWAEMAKGLTGVAATLVALTLFSKLSAANKGGVAQSVGIILLGAAIKILASAVSDFATMNWAEIGKGLSALAGLFAQLAIFSKVMSGAKGMAGAAVGMVILGGAMKILASALGDLAGMSWNELAKGLVGMAGALVIIAGAMRLMPKGMVVTAGSLVIVAAALKILTESLSDMGGMSWSEIAKSMVVLAGALIILAAAMHVMKGALAGAAAILIVAAALKIMVPALMMLAGLSIGELVIGLVALASVFVIFGAAALILGKITPIMIALAAAIALLGFGIGAIGAGVFLFASGLMLIAAGGAAAGVSLALFLTQMINLIPPLMEAVAKGIIAFAQTIKDGAPAIAEAVTVVVQSMLKTFQEIVPDIVDTIVVLTTEILAALETMIPDGVRVAKLFMMEVLQAMEEVGPQVVQTIFSIINQLIEELERSVPNFYNAALGIMKSILKGIADNIGPIADEATRIITEFLDAIGRNQPKIVDAGFRMIIDLINGVSKAISSNSAQLRAAGRGLGFAIADGMTGGLLSKVRNIASTAASVGRQAINAAKTALGIRSPSREFFNIGEFAGEGLVIGLENYSSKVGRAGGKMGKNAVDSVRKAISNMPTDFADQIDDQPTITPVLNLSEVERRARGINALLSVARLTPSVDSETASSIVRQERERGNYINRASVPTQENITFEQNNYSPEALSAADIYRNTKSQIAVLKGGLVH